MGPLLALLLTGSREGSPGPQGLSRRAAQRRGCGGELLSACAEPPRERKMNEYRISATRRSAAAAAAQGATPGACAGRGVCGTQLGTAGSAEPQPWPAPCGGFQAGCARAGSGRAGGSGPCCHHCHRCHPPCSGSRAAQAQRCGQAFPGVAQGRHRLAFGSGCFSQVRSGSAGVCLCSNTGEGSARLRCAAAPAAVGCTALSSLLPRQS